MKTPPITPRQQEIYNCWLANNQLYKPTARAMGIQPEKVRQAVASTLKKLGFPPPPPQYCLYCGEVLGVRNQSGYHAGECYEKSPQRRKRMNFKEIREECPTLVELPPLDKFTDEERRSLEIKKILSEPSAQEELASIQARGRALIDIAGSAKPNVGFFEYNCPDFSAISVDLMSDGRYWVTGVKKS